MSNEERLAGLAQNARLRAELVAVEEKLPSYVPYSGRVPRTLDEFNALPQPWRAQVNAENPGISQDLSNREIIARDLAERDLAASQQRAELAALGCPVQSMDQWNALSEAEKAETAPRVTSEAWNILTGIAGGAPKPGLFGD